MAAVVRGPVMAFIKTFLLMAAVQCLSYTNLVVNIRAIGVENVPMAVLTDMLASAIGFFVIRRVANDGTYAALFGMMFGGGVASWLGIYITAHWS